MKQLILIYQLNDNTKTDIVAEGGYTVPGKSCKTNTVYNASFRAY